MPKELGDSREDSRELTLPVHNRADGIETAIASIVPDIVEVQPPQASGSTLASSSQPATATQIASSSSQAIATSSLSTQATPSQPATSIPASQGIRPTRARARPKVEGGIVSPRIPLSLWCYLSALILCRKSAGPPEPRNSKANQCRRRESLTITSMVEVSEKCSRK